MDLFEEADPWNPKKDSDIVPRNEWASNGTPSLSDNINASLETPFRDMTLAGTTRETGLPTVAGNILKSSIWEDSSAANDEDILSERGPFNYGSNLSGNPAQQTTNEDVLSNSEVQEPHELSEDLNDWLKSVRNTYKPLSADIILIEQLPDREGLLFKHTNYVVKHLVPLPDTETSKDRSVIRRYSDFVWLQEVLLKRYPFRLIPELPPKKIGTQNADAVFLERRRRGLTRFINLVMKHPVLSKDDLLLTFLTVPTDLSSWRKQAIYDTTEEFSDKKITSSFTKMWQKEISEQWNEAEATTERSIEQWVKITVFMERYERRVKFMARERLALGSLVQEFSGTIPSLYPVQQGGTILDIKSHLSIIDKHLGSTEELCSERTKEFSTGLVPKFRIFIDVLLSLRGLFERYRLMAGNNIAQLQRRVEINTQKIEGMKDKPDVSGVEYDKIKSVIQRDKKTISEELNRAWLIRECILEEFTVFQETQFLISRAFQEWAKLNSTFAGLSVNQWEKLTDNLSDMPTSNGL
ncbi:Mvp1p TDEL_0G04310 [Torulaspora delbrueckii]|uniref:Sorting nexin MVP1 n=1 Tax=Torulaspora delbrueckii TaxID=4950 RepID=G8ZY31_TORDE|nr:hypothetical protein TDEL_0G04310 [Torulaspora delbrueckii]CCE93798.1 hypothetical protein TDEL_0G04310 [Torulaspora delbrueckii]